MAALLGATLALGAAGPARASDEGEAVGPGLRFSAFGTLGATYASTGDTYHFMREYGQRGNPGHLNVHADSRVGLQLNATLTPQWEAMAQLMVHQRVRSADPADSITAAFVAWRPTGDWTLRAGRVAPDLFLHTDVRNVSFVVPWVRPNTEVYGWLPFPSIDGGDATWQRTDAAGTWRVKAFAGGSTIGLDTSAGEPVRIYVRNQIGLALTREWDEWLLKIGLARNNPTLSDTPLRTQLQQSLAFIATLPVPAVAARARELQRASNLERVATYASIGLQYDRGPWLVQAEGNRTSVGGGMITGSIAAGYRFGPFTAYGMAGRIRPQGERQALPSDWAAALAPVVGPELAAPLQQVGMGAVAASDEMRGDQSSRSIGLRWDVDPRAALKLQFDRFHVHSRGALLWRVAGPSRQNVSLVSLNLDFAF